MSKTEAIVSKALRGHPLEERVATTDWTNAEQAKRGVDALAALAHQSRNNNAVHIRWAAAHDEALASWRDEHPEAEKAEEARRAAEHAERMDRTAAARERALRMAD